MYRIIHGTPRRRARVPGFDPTRSGRRMSFAGRLKAHVVRWIRSPHAHHKMIPTQARPHRAKGTLAAQAVPPDRPTGIASR
jgi:hypothetical protein